MRVCLKHRWLLLAGLLIALEAVPPAHAASAPGSAQPGGRVASVVRLNPDGRLVRTVVVLRKGSKTAPRRVIEPDRDLKALVDETARRYDLDPLLVHSVIQVESNYDPYAVSSKGAQGLMQLIPATARRFGVSNSFDVRQNLEGGVRYLAYLKSLYEDNLRLTLAAYNAGEGAVAKYGNHVPPYPETREYVEKVGRRYGSARKSAQREPEPSELTDEKLVAEEVHAPVRHFIDSEGRLHLSTASGTESASSP
ncbi:MAG: lytic transglycosylase domain-containing protein [Bryobacteraceae bacterium]